MTEKTGLPVYPDSLKAGLPDRLSDIERAAQYRNDLTLALQSVMEILGKARAQGLILGFSLQVDQFGKDFIGGNGITVARYL